MYQVIGVLMVKEGIIMVREGIIMVKEGHPSLFSNHWLLALGKGARRYEVWFKRAYTNTCTMIFATYCAILLDVAILPKMRILGD